MKRWSEPSLSATQEWVQRFITAPELTPEAQQQASDLIVPSPSLTAPDRIGVYRDMYLTRLVEALEIDYPALLHHLGAAGFGRIATAYLEAHPSQSYTLNRLGVRLPEFLAQSRLAFPAELARLELALTEVFDEAETPVLDAAALAALGPQDWASARLRPIAALRLLECSYPVSEYLGAVDQENPFPAIRRKRTWVAAYRRNFNVHRLNLSRPAYHLLQAVCAGRPLNEAVAACTVSEKRLFGWFQEWTAEGLFQAIECA